MPQQIIVTASGRVKVIEVGPIGPPGPTGPKSTEPGPAGPTGWLWGLSSDRPPAAEAEGMSFWDLENGPSFSDGVTWTDYPTPASSVVSDPVGELLALNVQDALKVLDYRTGTLGQLDRIGSIFTRVEDFTTPFTITAGTSPKTEGLINGTATGGAKAEAQPLPMMNGGLALTVVGTNDEVMLQFAAVTSPGPTCEFRTTMTTPDANPIQINGGWEVPGAGAIPDGMYFRIYRGSPPTIHAVCRNGGVETQVPITIPVTSLSSATFRVVPDGSGITRFYVNGELGATISTNSPSAVAFVVPTLRVRKAAGTSPRGTTLDYVAWAGKR